MSFTIEQLREHLMSTKTIIRCDICSTPHPKEQTNEIRDGLYYNVCSICYGKALYGGYSEDA